ncbi:hypothetical protein ACFX1S_041726 [Malus domestica]
MSLIPNPFGRRSGVFDPFSLDLWDHQVHHPFRSLSDLFVPVRNGVVRPRAHRLEGDADGARVQGGRAGAEEGGGEG